MGRIVPTPGLAVVLALGCSLSVAPAQRIGPAQQVELLNAHNELRRGVGVAGLKWSEALAARAERWAATLAARGCALQASGTEGFGENVFRERYVVPAGSHVRGLAP